MNPKYLIRVQAIVTADDNGANAANMDEVGVESHLGHANKIFAAENIQFVFDPALDFLPINNTLLNRYYTVLATPDILPDKWSVDKWGQDKDGNFMLPPKSDVEHLNARMALVNQYKGKLVLFFSYGGVLKKYTPAGKTPYYALAPHSGGFSSSTMAWVSLLGGQAGIQYDITFVAHEIGHYLQTGHPFYERIYKTVNDLIEHIKKEVPSRYAFQDGLRVVDPDYEYVSDTPPDIKGDLFNNLPGGKCGPQGSITIPVTFNDGHKETYTLAPDRANVMSYYKTCKGLGPHHFSPQQIRRHREALEIGTRHHLISLRAKKYYKNGFNIHPVGHTTAEQVQEADIVTVKTGRVVTAAREDNGELKVTAWDVKSGGNQVVRLGSATGGQIQQVRICEVGGGLVATTVRTEASELKVILWQIGETGLIKQKGEASLPGAVKDLAACRLGLRHLATAVQKSDGTIEVSAWYLTVQGEVYHLESQSAGEISVAGKLAMCPVGHYSFAVHFPDHSGNQTIGIWEFKDGKLLAHQKMASGQSQLSIGAACHLDLDLVVSAFKGKNGRLKLVSWGISDDVKQVNIGPNAEGMDVVGVACCRMGLDLLVTAVQDSTGKLRVFLWEIGPNGSFMIERAHWEDEVISADGVCHVGWNLTATVGREAGGMMRIITWRLDPAVLDVGDQPEETVGLPPPSIPIYDPPVPVEWWEKLWLRPWFFLRGLIARALVPFRPREIYPVDDELFGESFDDFTGRGA